GHFRVLLAAIAEDPRRPVADLPLMTEEEERRSLFEWNDTAADYPLDRCIHELIEGQAARTPDAPAVVFNELRLSYRELNERANRLARCLRSQGVGAESLVGVLLERGVEMMVGILAVLKAGGAYVPLDPSYPPQRLSFSLQDARPSVLLTKRGLADGLPDGGVPFVLLDADARAIARESAADLGHTAGPDNLAYVIYSSGSTGTPKGVPVVHRGLVNSTLARLDHYAEAVHAFLLLPSFAFDTSVGVIFWTLCRGGALVIPDVRLHQDPRYLARLVARHRVSHLIGLPSLYALLLEQARPGQLDSLKTVVVAGEACPAELPARHFEALPAASLYNEYGPTEATVWCSVHDFDAREAGAPVTIGRPIANTSLYLLDENLRPVPVGVHGELYVGGANLARGYLKRPALTAERFVPDPFSKGPGARLYRTGDVARYAPDGRIEFLGRNDQQVKIRGFRVELMEIEATLEQLPSVRQAVVLARDDAPGGKRLVAYVVPEGASELAPGELRGHLRERLPDYMVPAAFIFLEEFPLNPSGKVNRRRLPAPDWSRPGLEDEFVAARTPVEELLAGMWAELLGLERVGAGDNFFELGGHSLLATQVVSRLSDIFKVDIPLRTLFESPVVASFAEAVTALMADEAAGDDQPVLPVPRHGELPLSFAQQRLWFLDQLQPDSPFYNISGAARLSGELDPSALEKGLNEVVRRHESLRTTFDSEGGQPHQIISDALHVHVPLLDLSALPEAERDAEGRRAAAAEAARPFDLRRGPLLRALLVRLTGNEHLLVVTMHHIVSDGWSVAVLFGELSVCYEAFTRGLVPELPPLRIQYADYAVWQRVRAEAGLFDAGLRYWAERLAGAPPLLALPTDRPRPPVQTHRGASFPFELGEGLTAGLRSLARRHSATLFMVLLAGFKALLSRYAGETDVVVGTPVANRDRAELEPLVGFFVNTLALRTDVSGDPGFGELVGRVREGALGGYAHQEVPFERVVEELRPERSLNHAPLFQVMLAFDTTARGEVRLGGAAAAAEGVGSGAAKFDLTVSVREEGGRLACGAEYSTDLYEEATVRGMMRHFERLLEGAVADPERRVSELPL
ncbi:MAG TPA: amino acid adenylation domain-containing protein, partial [Pyrinomonadaceae bacterium]